MDIHYLFDFLFHLEGHLAELAIMPLWAVYLIFFAVIFIETGVVVMPFLPGDSFLFVVGTFVAINNAQGGQADIVLACCLLMTAAILGDTVNYHLGKYIGPRAFQFNDSRFFNKKALLAAQAYYDKHGGKTIVIARFMPFVRTFAPFVAGIGQMHYGRFLMFNATGAVLWVLSFVGGGYLFGQLPFVVEHYSKFTVLIIVLSLLPLAFAYYKSKTAPDAAAQVAPGKG